MQEKYCLKQLSGDVKHSGCITPTENAPTVHSLYLLISLISYTQSSHAFCCKRERARTQMSCVMPCKSRHLVPVAGLCARQHHHDLHLTVPAGALQTASGPQSWWFGCHHSHWRLHKGSSCSHSWEREGQDGEVKTFNMWPESSYLVHNSGNQFI